MAKRPFTIFPTADGTGRFAVETPSRFVPGLRHPTVAAAMLWAMSSAESRNDGPHDIEVRL